MTEEKKKEGDNNKAQPVCPFHWYSDMNQPRCGAKFVKKSPLPSSYPELGQFYSEIWMHERGKTQEEFKKFGFGGRTDATKTEPIFIYYCEKGHYVVRPDWYADVPVAPYEETTTTWEWSKEVSRKVIKERSNK